MGVATDDLVEDRPPAAYHEIPTISQSTYDACQAWADATARLKAAQKGDSHAASHRPDPWRIRMDSAVCHRPNQEKCIGCGRCYKVCPRDVLDLVERELEDDDEDDDNMMVMSIANANDCIGCGSCGRVCPKDCYSYEPLAA